MEKARLLAVMIIFSLGLTFCSAEPSAKSVLCGVWYVTPTPPSNATTANFSWGKGIKVVNGSIEIDTYGQNETIFLPGMGGPFKITKLSWDGQDTIDLSFFFDRGNFQVDFKVHYDRQNGTIWFEDPKNLNFVASGSSHLWYKISGPEKK